MTEENPQSPSIIPSTGDIDQDRAAMIDGKIVWFRVSDFASTTMYLDDDETAYVLRKAEDWDGPYARHFADAPQFAHEGKQWVWGDIEDFVKDDHPQFASHFRELWDKATKNSEDQDAGR